MAPSDGRCVVRNDRVLKREGRPQRVVSAT